MTIKSSGLISMADICTELGLSTSSPRSLNDSDIRTLLGKPSGSISLADAYGKSNIVSIGRGAFKFAYSTNYSEWGYSYISTVMGGGYGTGSSTPDPVYVNNSSVYVFSLDWSTGFGNPRLSIFLSASVGSTLKLTFNGKTYTLTEVDGPGAYYLFGVSNMLNNTDIFNVTFSH